MPEAVPEEPEPVARLVPEAEPLEPVALAELEAAPEAPEVAAPPFRTMVVELLALTTRVRVELPVPATGMV